MSEIARGQTNMASIYQLFGEKVKKLRKEKNMTQEDLAEAIDRDARTIVAIEAGRRNTTLKTVQKIAQALKVKPADLLS